MTPETEAAIQRYCNAWATLLEKGGVTVEVKKGRKRGAAAAPATTSPPPAPATPTTPPAPLPGAALLPPPVPPQAAPSGDLAGLNRKQLVDIAKQLGLAPKAKKRGEVLAMIEAKRAEAGGAPAAAAAPATGGLGGALGQPAAPTFDQEKAATWLTGIVDAHEAALSPSIDALGCGGDCYDCPKPEPTNATVQAQMESCTASLTGWLQQAGHPVPPLG